jgi:hypothetical protein
MPPTKYYSPDTMVASKAEPKPKAGAAPKAPNQSGAVCKVAVPSQLDRWLLQGPAKSPPPGVSASPKAADVMLTAVIGVAAKVQPGKAKQPGCGGSTLECDYCHKQRNKNEITMVGRKRDKKKCGSCNRLAVKISQIMGSNSELASDWLSIDAEERRKFMEANETVTRFCFCLLTNRKRKTQFKPNLNEMVSRDAIAQGMMAVVKLQKSSKSEIGSGSKGKAKPLSVLAHLSCVLHMSLYTPYLPSFPSPTASSPPLPLG